MKTILVDAMHTFFIKGEGIFEEMYELLETFKTRKIILTNANDEEMVKSGMDKAPYEVFTLKHNPDKPNRRYYENMLAYFGLDAGEVIYFEHDAEAVKSAQSVGIKTLHYDENKKDLEELKSFLLANA